MREGMKKEAFYRGEGLRGEVVIQRETLIDGGSEEKATEEDEGERSHLVAWPFSSTKIHGRSGKGHTTSVSADVANWASARR